MPSHNERYIIDRDSKFGPPLEREVDIDDTRTNLNNHYRNGVIKSLYQQEEGKYTENNPEHITEPVPSTLSSYDENNQSLNKRDNNEPVVNNKMALLSQPTYLNNLPTPQDGGRSIEIINNPFITDKIYEMEYFKGLKHSKGLFDSNEIDLYNKTYRFGLFNPNAAVSGVREVLFFTKPDLSILKRGDNDPVADKSALSTDLSNRTFWVEMFEKRKEAIYSLQGSADGWNDPFNHLLQNTVSSNLTIPDLSSDGIETTKNAYGVNITYRSSSEASNDSFDFSLEFRDTKWLDVYYYFKMYEEYETLKHHGLVKPWKPYITSKILHDQFSIYKFLLDDDNETILYYAKFWGVYPKSLPRDTFSNTSFDSGIVYSVDFKAQFFDDSDPMIISEFNNLSRQLYNTQDYYRLDVYNDYIGRIDGRPAIAAYIVEDRARRSPTGKVYKLKWKGSDTE